MHKYLYSDSMYKYLLLVLSYRYVLLVLRLSVQILVLSCKYMLRVLKIQCTYTCLYLLLVLSYRYVLLVLRLSVYRDLSLVLSVQKRNYCYLYSVYSSSGHARSPIAMETHVTVVLVVPSSNAN